LGIELMADSILGTVIEHLAADDPAVRNISLNWLCEGYVDEPGVTEAVFQQWESRSPEHAFTQFPMLGYFPVAAPQVSQACEIAARMIAQRAGVTSTVTRCAGKLVEQLARLPATDLAPHLQQITALVESHKIFFRFDLPGLKQRLQLLHCSPDQLMEMLESSINRLVSSPQDDPARQQAQRALEALRRFYPEQLDISRSLQLNSGNPADAISCELALHSLCHFADNTFADNTAVGPQLGQLLHSSAQSLLAMAVEALVRSGTGEAARLLVDAFQEVSLSNRPWIARGLQRMRVHNLATLIAELKDQTADESLRRMLLVAEMQQLDPRSGSRMVQAFDELESVTPQLLDAGMLYVFVCGPLQDSSAANELEESYRDLLLRVQQSQLQASADIAETSDGAANGGANGGVDGVADKRTLRRHQAKQIKRAFKRGRES
jgi:hypothetical protein